MDHFSNYLKRNDLQQKDYQIQGITQMNDIEKSGVKIGSYNIKSGILADEMGLGKTTQMIGLILSNFKLHNLIVLPRALIQQWTDTIYNTTGHKPLVFYGKQANTTNLHTLKHAPIVITSYGILKKTQKIQKTEKYASLDMIHWDRIIFDEAHHLRNKKTLIHKKASEIQATHKWLVTGTPIQNSIKDLKGLCEILGIHSLELTKKKYQNTIQLLNNIIIKRTKQEVGIILPPLYRHIINVEWDNDLQREISKNIHSLLKFSKLENTNNFYSNIPAHHFVVLQQARQSCNDFSLLQKSLETFQEYGLDINQSQLNDIISTNSKFNHITNVVLENIKNNNNNNNNKCLIFAHYRKEIDNLANMLKQHNLNVETFDGRTSFNERNKILSNTNIDCLILQIQTGCEGLNLQHFNQIYFTSPHWNPAIEDQAIARCHRIGQTKPVDVFIFKMMPFDTEKQTRTIDKYIGDIHREKRIDINKLNTDPIGTSLNKDCAICMQPLHQNTTDTLDCKHQFHRECIQQWMVVGSRCPTCREPI